MSPRRRKPAPLRRVVFEMTPLQAGWLDTVAEMHGWTPTQVLVEAIACLALRETRWMARTRHYERLAMIAKLDSWDPLTDFLAAHEEEA